MEKILIKDAEQWGWWELASKTMGDDPATIFPCSDCDQSVVAKEAMHDGWVRLALVGETEPESEPKVVEGGKFYCPECQVKLGIDIEEGYAKRAVPEKPSSSRRGRGGRRNNSRRESASGTGKEKSGRNDSKPTDGEKKSNGGNGSQRSGNRRGRGRRSRRPRSKGDGKGPAPNGSNGPKASGGSQSSESGG